MKPIKISLVVFFILQILLTNSYLGKAQANEWKDRVVEDSIPQYILPSIFLYGMNEWIIGDACSDAAEVGGYWPIDAPDDQKMSIFDIRAGQFPIFTYYRWNYFGIKLCNQFLKFVGNNPLPPAIQYQQAEILFYRALFYYNLVRLFGDVPIYTENDIPNIETSGNETIYQLFMPVIQSDSIHKPRAKTSEVWQMIENDLTTAIPDLPQKSAFNGDLWNHVTKGAALTLMEKAKLYQKDWAGVLNYANYVIKSTEYALEDTFINCFGINKHGKESIFELEQYPDGVYTGLPSTYESYWPSFEHNVLYNPRNVYEDWPNSNQDYLSTYYGYGFNCPKQNYAESFAQGDPRKKATIISQDDSIISRITKNGIVWEVMDPLNKRDSNDQSTKSSPTGHYNRKYFVSYMETCDAGNCTFGIPHKGSFKNIRVFRYADVLLMAAEAYYQMGNTDSALYYVNLIRTRARNSGITGKPKNLTSVTLDSIYNERKWEFGGEGYRLFDLLRTGKAYQAINGTHNNTFDTTVSFDSTKHYLFPIPVQDIVISGGILTQNPGYETADMIKDIKKIKPFEDIVTTIDTAKLRLRKINSTIDLGSYEIGDYFDLDSFLEIGAVPIFSSSSRSNFGKANFHLNNPDMNGDECEHCYQIDLTYELYNCNSPSGGRQTINFPFTDTLIFSVYNFIKYVSDTFTLTFKPKVTSLTEQIYKESKVTYMPNPVNNFLIIQFKDIPDKLYDIYIYSAAGTLMYSTKVNRQNTTLDVSLFTPGIYIIRIPELNTLDKLIIKR